jgi:hypothetical protein
VREEPVRFVGGMRYRARGGLLSGGPNLTWPLATLELSPDNISVAPRWRLAARFLPPVEIALGDITAVETDFGITGGGIRFRLPGPADGTVFWAMGSKKTALLDALRSAGLDVQ